jgi:phage gp29-like protein
MDSLLRGTWSAVPYGYSVVEAVYAKGPRVGLASVQEKPLEWFEPKRDGSLTYKAPTGGAPPVVVDSVAKFLLTRRSATYRNPYGEALLSRLYWAWFFRHNGWKFWMRYLERFSDPLLLGTALDPEATLKVLQGQGLEFAVVVGAGETLTAVTAGAAGEFDKLEMAVGRRIQKLILGQTLTSEVGDKGSYAAAQVHNQVRDDKRVSDLRLVTPTVQRLCDALWTLNALPGVAPTFVLQDDRGLDLPRAERDAKLVQSGVLTLTDQYLLDRYDFEPGDFTVGAASATNPGGAQDAAAALGATVGPKDLNAYAMGIERLAGMMGVPEGYVRDTTGIPAPAAGEPALAPSAPGVPATALEADPGRSGMGGPQGVLLAAPKPQRFTQDQAAVEALADAALAQAASPIPAAKIRAAILAADDPDDLLERLAKLYAGEDAAAFKELVERSLFAADVLGYCNAQQRVGGG